MHLAKYTKLSLSLTRSLSLLLSSESGTSHCCYPVALEQDCRDSRFTTWYQTGRTSTRDPEYTSTYGNYWMSTVAKACLSGPGCSANSDTTGWSSPTLLTPATGPPHSYMAVDVAVSLTVSLSLHLTVSPCLTGASHSCCHRHRHCHCHCHCASPLSPSLSLSLSHSLSELSCATASSLTVSLGPCYCCVPLTHCVSHSLCLSPAFCTGVGVWSSDWRIDSLATTLTALQDGFSGSLAIVDPSGIVLSSSSGLSVSPALTCGDAYIQDAAQQVNTLCIPSSVPTSVLMMAPCVYAFW